MTPKILVVDRNQAFASMLRDMLESEGGYTVTVSNTGSGALSLLSQHGFDLAIVDMDMDPDDLSFEELLGSARQVAPRTRLMLIPLAGDVPPPDLLELNIQGTLSKPFFVDDLLPSVRDALAQPAEMPTRKLETGSSPDHQGAPISERLRGTLAELNRELNADTVLLLSESHDTARVIFQSSSLNGSRLRSLAELCTKMMQASRAAANLARHSAGTVLHNMFEDEQHRLYMLGLPSGMLLVVSTPTSTPLGTIRHNLRQVIRKLTEEVLS